MVKYKITLGRAEITKVYPDRETDKFVVFGHRREAKLSSDVCYFDGFDEAKYYLLENLVAWRDRLQRHTNNAYKTLSEARLLHEDN